MGGVHAIECRWYHGTTVDGFIDCGLRHQRATTCLGCVYREPAKSINSYEPLPIKNDNPAVWDLVMQDMKERDQIGRQKYGTPLQPHNGRDVLKDAYQEALDLAVYLRQAIYERDRE